MATHPGEQNRRGSRSRWPADYAAFRRRLVHARESRGLTQQQVADRLGVVQSWVARCETGERRVDVIELRQFAKLYRKRLSYFIAEE